MKSGNFTILAPAGSLEHVKVAVEEGADAIYVGPKFLSGRSGYAEMSLEDVEEARRITQGTGVSLFIAVNRAMPIGKEKMWKESLLRLAQINPDALIVGSFCVYSTIVELGLNIPLHASTFLGIYNPKGASFVKKLGFERLILNTSLYIDEIEAITSSVKNLEYEIIAYGGICLNDNHRCNLPHGIRIKTPSRYLEVHSRESTYCQLRLTVSNDRGEVLKRGRILCYPVIDLSPHLGIFIRAGIKHFKIAGRERSPQFVKVAIRKLREGIKRALEYENIPFEVYPYLCPITRRGQDAV